MSPFSCFKPFIDRLRQSKETRYPPPYSEASPSTQPGTQSHNASCKVFKEWQKEGEESTNYKYDAWVLPEKLLGELAYDAQIKCLEYFLKLQKIHPFELKVRCILHNPYSGNQDTNLDVYMDIMAAKDMTTIVSHWEKFQNPRTEIDENIDSIIIESPTSDSEFGKTKDELFPFLLAKVATSQEGWPLDEFLERKDEIFRNDNLFPCSKGPAITGQFKVQSLSALRAIRRQTPQALYALNFVPETVANTTYNTVRSFFQPVDEALQQNSNIRRNNARVDSYSIKLLSFGSRDKPQRGNQWQQWDDDKSGNEDITDYTCMDATRFNSEGPGPKFAAKILLAAASPDLDRKNYDSGLYGDGTDLSLEEWKNCPACRSSKAAHSGASLLSKR
ncbi:hypothetical protein FOPG_18440 [Fusarium oxysporum f. sp. conglutinans race 2 54008]|uniref:Uncharacterized protein n=3 Tax=Fusarium oxysporum f. sp. conglutinans TaxID=100902 RepID=A0A8H6LCK7_FUSOX|nr:hypothetical protein FOXB_17428 [Fusarium oxysporum f. sp. conglutinans Fo5176]EXL65325.1 hypothetical protein FOPG_18440 [Fusarium oxysporum f. sp. conglutinans race 2 54008]KAF6514171.1 hypothetical protein HZS61_006427 [Fusarium oxysporum f. sp. conglutinans]KAG6988650.1 hypothetical protein FocnCong_v001779 [Fusarium oxysporum f. sp. conglutinans]KAI8397373.1 hypothetical protein FOFC_20645 [Fusarium oxysporum]